MKLKKPNLNSKGFSHVEMIIALVVIVAIAGVGIFVYKHHQDSNKSMNMMGTTSSPVLGAPVKSSSVMVNGKSLSSVIPGASALNLSHIDTEGFGWDIYACRTYTPVYGGVYAIQAFYYKPTTVGAKSYLTEYYPGSSTNKLGSQIQQKSSTSYFYNRVTELTMNVSVLNSNHVVSFDEVQLGGSSTNKSIIQMVNNFTVTNIGKDLVGC